MSTSNSKRGYLLLYIAHLARFLSLTCLLNAVHTQCLLGEAYEMFRVPLNYISFGFLTLSQLVIRTSRKAGLKDVVGYWSIVAGLLCMLAVIIFHRVYPTDF